MPPAHISCSRHNVQNDNVVQAYPLTSTCFVAYGYIERTLAGNTECCFVCLHSVVLV
jgi:hypothetical protein